jgi:RHS repeat-associated protein
MPCFLCLVTWDQPFGEELGPQTVDKTLFAGQEPDFETGQDYFNARQLRPDLGRLLTPDPKSSVPRVVGSQGINS